MKKIIAILIALLLTLGTLVGCKDKAPTTNNTESGSKMPEQIRVLALKGPTGIGVAKMMEDGEDIYSFTVASAPTEATASVLKGEVDIAALPTNLAATLYKRSEKGVRMIGINTLGSLYVLENGNTIHSLADLRGKKIYATGKGANPEYVLKYLLQKNGLTVGNDLEIEFLAEHSELAALMASGECVLGMLPEPNVSSAMAQNKNLRIALNLNDEWNKIADQNSRLTMGCVVVRTEFLEQYPDAVSKFLTDLEASIGFAKDNAAEAGTLCEKHGIVPKAALATKAIPNCNLTLIKGADMKPAIEGYFNVLFTANPTSVGGSLPDEEFYYIP